MSFVHRKAVSEDAPLLSVNTMRCSLEAGDKWDEAMIKELEGMYTEQFSRLIREDSLVFYLAFDGNTLAGMGGIYIWNTEETAGKSTISHIYTLPEYRRRGIAKQIMSLLIQTAKERKCASVECIVEEDKRPILKKIGFQDVYDEDEDGIWGLSDQMELFLTMEE